ncbi:MAG: hypothetical protein AVDCRST_MAG69-337 [uncultured Solirubrobacteraceae bacterium]|uniref:Post-SET domain-containing protein n=1 Tax=uncultured Solirubrobacteraceae bacterium TaxID=1162706 RepID=A0A6J4RTD4_9ACTN|nr:MAG: hypothetical protein AVDCRST_MAG69-337 [uncultured Solirubrobacteraceae bacterium]
MDDQRAERIALNESRFRQINDGLRDDLAKLPSEPEAVPFVCECGSNACEGLIEVTLAEYEGIRANSRHFLVLPGHEIVEAERVLASTPRYMVVEKQPGVGPLVDATDPRRGPH